MGGSRSAAQMDRACGVLLGQACGDALGVPYEFGRPPAAHEQARMLGGGLGPYKPGEYSDDTQMASCVAEAAAKVGGLPRALALDEIAESFLHWQSKGASDIGAQTRSVLIRARHGDGSPGTRLREAAVAYAETHTHSAGNGALMRTAIVGISALDDRDATATHARAVAELTHGDPLAGDACVLWSEAIRVAVLRKDLDITGGLDLIPEARRDQWATWITEAETQPPSTFNPNGFTVSALQAAWAAIVQTDPANQTSGRESDCQHLQDALHAVIRIGNDTDTIAAIAGGLLGAYWGQSAIPLDWVRRVHGWPGYRARDLVRLAALTVNGGQSDVQGWPGVEHLDYGEPPRPAGPHPADDGVWLGTIDSTDHDATAIVSLCRLGVADAPALGVRPEDHLEVRLIDTEDPEANPNLDFTIADTAKVVRALREEGHRVLVHCVRAEQRTPAIALAYSRLLGTPTDVAMDQIIHALPGSRRTGRLWEAALGVWRRSAR